MSAAKDPLRLQAVKMWLDSYNDLFSDFDPRHVSERALSSDFLAELKRATQDILRGRVHLVLLLAARRRSRPRETMILERLKAHFTRHSLALQLERKRVRIRAILQGTAGLALMLALVFFKDASLPVRALTLLAEAVGWYFFWSGMDQLFFSSTTRTAEIQFYEKMAQASIEFQNK